MGMLDLLVVIGAVAICPWGHGHHSFGDRGADTYAAALNWPGYSVWPPGTTFEQRVAAGYKPYWYQAQVPVMAPRVTYKLETTPVRSYVYVAKQVEEPQLQTTYVPVARIVEEPVTTTLLLPLLIPGPDGRQIVTCRPEVSTHIVKRTVHDMKPVTREYRVKVTRMVPQETVTNVQQLVPVVVYDQKLTTQWQYTWVPYQWLQTVPTFDPHHAPQLFWP